MKALSVRQPWAWLIVNGYKNIENRNRPTHYRGRVLIHASTTIPNKSYVDEARSIAGAIIGRPLPVEFDRGGIVGAVDIIGCVDKSDSPWFMGAYGYALAKAKVLPFTPYKGMLGLFDVPDDLGEVTND